MIESPTTLHCVKCESETTKLENLRYMAVRFMSEFDKFMEKQDLFPDDLAEAYKELTEAICE